MAPPKDYSKYADALAPSPGAPIEQRMLAETHLLRVATEKIAASRLVNYPIWVVGWGVVISTFLWLFLISAAILITVMVGGFAIAREEWARTEAIKARERAVKQFHESGRPKDPQPQP